MTSATLEREAEILDLFDVERTTSGVEWSLQADEIIVDCFAGGGGVSTGIEWATERSPDIAINHSKTAIAIHEANHPTSEHYQEDVWHVDPVKACRGRRVGLGWFSPDCTHFSKAKGNVPLSKKIRALAHVVVRWGKAVRPRVMVVENVEEFLGWGPISRKTGRPDPLQKGKHFRAWVRQLRRLGYVVEWRLLRACDFGAPTIRRRLIIIARCDGQPIRWPKPTHGPGRARPWRTAAECIDWTLPCPSIFLSREEGRTLGVRRPLAEKTLRRIARGVRRYVLDAAEPFIVPVQNFGWGDEPRSVMDPMRTITAHPKGGGFALSIPTLIQTGYGEREGQAPRVPGLDKPLGTVVGCGQKHALVAAFLAKHFGGNETPGAPLVDPVHTVTGTDHHALVTTTLAAPVIVEPGQRHGRGQNRADAPLTTVVAKDRHALVSAFLTTYYSNGGQDASLAAPAPTVVSKDKIGLVTVHGELYAIADIGMRMLAPRELATAQGFPPSYKLEVLCGGLPLSKRAQVEMVGNSVPPQLAEAVIRANLGVAATQERAA